MFTPNRLLDRPLIRVDDNPRLEGNVNGPSLIRVPQWVEAPLGRYYLYFAHHEGTSIRLAYADALTGPWTLHPPGALTLADALFPTEPPAESDLDPRVQAIIAAGFDDLYPHIASPDVLVDDAAKCVRMYFHGRHVDGRQLTRVATSPDGLRFTAHEEILGPPYFRVFAHAGDWYALAMPGIFLRSRDGLSNFEPGPSCFNANMRHSALLHQSNTLHVFWTQVGDAPERILRSAITLDDNWLQWSDAEPAEVLRPERAWEGAHLPVEPSRRGSIMTPVNQLRDPGIFEEDGQVYLLYAVAGEQGIAVARLD
jgi:hypothetical protein